MAIVPRKTAPARGPNGRNEIECDYQETGFHFFVRRHIAGWMEQLENYQTEYQLLGEDGFEVGCDVGPSDGAIGFAEGETAGGVDGEIVWLSRTGVDGTPVGRLDGTAVDGSAVGLPGVGVGPSEGAAVGCLVGVAVGVAVGAAVGCLVGVAVGAAVGCLVGVAVGVAAGAFEDTLDGVGVVAAGHVVIESSSTDVPKNAFSATSLGSLPSQQTNVSGANMNALISIDSTEAGILTLVRPEP